MKLYNSNYSPQAKRLRVLANELNLKLDVQELDFMKGDNKKPEYLAKNPMGKIPTLEDDGYVIWESPAAMIYMASKANSPLLPKGAKEHAELFKWMFWNASHFENAAFVLVGEKVVKPMMMGQQPDVARVTLAMKDWERFVPIFNGHLEGKQWVLGNDFSIADIAIGTTVESTTMPQVGCTYDRYTHIKAWLGRVTSRDSWKKATPG